MASRSTVHQTRDNGLIAPIIDYFTRGHVAKETVAKRVAGVESAEGSL